MCKKSPYLSDINPLFAIVLTERTLQWDEHMNHVASIYLRLRNLFINTESAHFENNAHFLPF